MAEGFARTYGSDIVVPASAGLGPAPKVASDTIAAMQEKSINLRDHFPKSIRHLGRIEFDLVINMSGVAIPDTFRCEVRDWEVPDPVYMSYDDHCVVRDEIERLVMNLILELRRVRQQESQLRPFGTGSAR
jgi:protein-tyrosine-phosphatase